MSTPNRPPEFRGVFDLPDELVVDNFAGGGGASTGLEAAIGRPAISERRSESMQRAGSRPGLKRSGWAQSVGFRPCSRAIAASSASSARLFSSAGSSQVKAWIWAARSRLRRVLA